MSCFITFTNVLERSMIGTLSSFFLLLADRTVQCLKPMHTRSKIRRSVHGLDKECLTLCRSQPCTYVFGSAGFRKHGRNIYFACFALCRMSVSAPVEDTLVEGRVIYWHHLRFFLCLFLLHCESGLFLFKIFESPWSPCEVNAGTMWYRLPRYVRARKFSENENLAQRVMWARASLLALSSAMH